MLFIGILFIGEKLEVALKLEGKQIVVAKISEVAEMAHSAVVAEYRGLTVAAMTRLRVQARDAGVYLQVVRNTLARRALEASRFACLHASLCGPVVLMFSQREPSAAARVVRDFAKENKQLAVKCLAFDGRLWAAKDLDKLASLPTRDEAIANLMAVMEAPIARCVHTLAEPLAKLMRLLVAVRDKLCDQ